MLDTLPLELISFILNGHLTIDQLLICRCISKKFCYVIDNLIGFHSFCIYELYLPWNKIWFSTTNHYVLTRSTLHRVMQMTRKVEQEPKLYHLLATATLSRLKSLYINMGSCLSTRLVDSLNQLICLEQLRMSVFIDEKLDLLVLSLPHLKILDCWVGSKMRESQLTLVCPKLDRLRIRYEDTFRHLEIVHPESIVHLQCPVLDRKIKELINLEVLYCQFPKEDAIEDDFLVSLPKLQELHFDSKDAFVKLAEQRRQYNQELDQRKRPQSYQPALYLLGVRLDQLPAYQLRSMSHILWSDRAKLLFSNYSNIARLIPFARQLHYEIFKNEPTPPGWRPSHFAERLVNLNHFLVYDTRDVTHLIDLLSSLRNIINLTFQFTKFGQNIFNSIPFHCPNVLCLRINLSDELTNSLTFWFLLRFEFLHEFHTNHHFDRTHSKVIQRLFKRLQYFCSFNAVSGGNFFEINLDSDTRQFELKNGLHIHHFRTLPELLVCLFSGPLDSCSIA